MRKTITLTIALLVTQAFAQLNIPLSQYSGNQIVYNPGYAGMRDSSLSANLSMRQLWVGMPGSPRLISFNSHAPLKNERHAIGLVLQREEWGPMNAHFGYANYAHKVSFGQGVLNLGLQAGFINSSTNRAMIKRVQNGEDPGLSDDDMPGITRFDVNFGAHFQTAKFYAGFAIRHLTRPKFDTLTIPNGQHWYSETPSQYIFTAGYNYTLNDRWSLHPEVLMRVSSSTTAPLLNFGLQASYQSRHFFGVNWQAGYQRAVSLIARTAILPDLHIGYSYDIYYGGLSSFQKGSHEVAITYVLNSPWRKKSAAAATTEEG